MSNYGLDPSRKTTKSLSINLRITVLGVVTRTLWRKHGLTEATISLLKCSVLVRGGIRARTEDSIHCAVLY